MLLPGKVHSYVAWNRGSSYVKLYLVYHLWPEGEYPDILLVHTTKGMQVSMDTQLLCSMEHSQRLTAPHTNQMSGSKIAHLEKDVSYIQVTKKKSVTIVTYTLYSKRS